MDNTDESCGKLWLIEEEEADIEITEDEVKNIRRKSDLCLVGKLWMDRVINKGVVEATMGKIWRLSSKSVFKEVNSNVLTVSFVTKEYKTRVENGRP